MLVPYELLKIHLLNFIKGQHEMLIYFVIKMIPSGKEYESNAQINREVEIWKYFDFLIYTTLRMVCVTHQVVMIE